MASDNPDAELLAIMEEWRANQAQWTAWDREYELTGYDPADDDETAALIDARIAIEERTFAIQPETLAGVAGLAAIARNYFDGLSGGADKRAIGALLDAVEGMAAKVAI
jgi:hypothetical protein